MKKHIKNFSKFCFIGFIWTLLNIFLMWLTIDIIKMPTAIGSTIVVLFLFVTRFYVYVLIRLIYPKFIKYSVTNISFALANIILVWTFIDIFKIPTVISSAVVVYGLFIIKFIVFNKVGLIKNNR